jgi:peptide/nickel transport system ATP-binding protein
MTAAAATPGSTILSLVDVKVHYPILRGFLRRVVGHVKAVDGVSLDLRQGETLGLVGESGSGKTSLARAVLRIVDATHGEIAYIDASGGRRVINRLDKRALREVRRQIRMIFQDPHSSLDPRYTVHRIIAEPLLAYGAVAPGAAQEAVGRLLEMVGLRREHADRHPHMFSGGERQRIGIARALALGPRVVVCDEAVSALDVSVQAQVINLLQDLQERGGLTYLFVSHDLSVVRHIADRVAVMYSGRLAELGETEAIFSRPLHPYTEALLSAAPIADPHARAGKARIRLEGDVPDPADPPAGCRFHPRCRHAAARCRTEEPEYREVLPGRHASCHFAGELDLRGSPKGE